MIRYAVRETEDKPNRNGRLIVHERIGILSFGHWTPSRQSCTQSAAGALLQSIDLAVEVEHLGIDDAYFRGAKE